MSSSRLIGVRYASIFKACVEIALNAPVIKRAPKAYICANFITSIFWFPFFPVGICQIDAP